MATDSGAVVQLELRTDDRAFWATLLADPASSRQTFLVSEGPSEPGAFSEIFTVHLQIDLVNFSASVAAGVIANWITARWRSSGSPPTPLSVASGGSPGATVTLGEDEHARIAVAVADALASRYASDGPDRV